MTNSPDSMFKSLSTGTNKIDTKLKEECGVFGIYSNDEETTARQVYFGLFALQHRGQESCGIAINDFNHKFVCHKDIGLVSDVFSNERIDSMKGNVAIGHTRYSTCGDSTRQNAQPLAVSYLKGSLAVVHNGNIANVAELKSDLEKEGAIFQSTNDTEVIAYLLAQARARCSTIEEAARAIIPLLKGSYSLLIMSPKKLIAVRDPYGIRPLCIGERENGDVVFASESCALDTVKAKFVRDVRPGEIVVAMGEKDKGYKINGIKNIVSDTFHCSKNDEKSALCIFEYIYFARPDSVLDSQSVYESRVLAGRALAKRHKVEADVVIGVPDSGMMAAVGYSEESGIPYGVGLIKNRYIGRTFIQPTQSMREQSVMLKLNVLRQTIQNKRVVLVDDSIVRGTTTRNIIKLLNDAGAKEVHVRISSPKFLYPCFFGTDVPNRNELAAVKFSNEELCERIGAKTLGFMDIEDLKSIIVDSKLGFCSGCFTGNYPYGIKVE